MKKGYSILIILIGLFSSGLKAQITLTVPSANPIGTGAANTTHRKPLGSYYGYERSAMKYLFREIGTSGTITSVSFYCDTINSNTGASTPVKIFLKEVSDSTFAAGTLVNTEETNSSLVFNGTLNAAQFVPHTFVTITLSNPFVYTGGTNNLEVIVETNAGGTGNEGQLSKGFRYYSTGSDSAYRFQFWQQDVSVPTGAGTVDYNRPNIQFTLVPTNACSGAPIAGNTVASDSSVCAGAAFSLGLQGSPSDSGLTYQWQSSPDGLSWSSLTGAVSPYLSASISDTTYFSCLVSCGSNSSVSTPVYITLNAPVYCYCTTGLGGSCNSNAIDAFSISGTGLSNSGTGCANNAGPNYSAYPASGTTTATLTAGQTYTVSATMTGDDKVSLWIDYNHDGIFGINEWTRICTTSVNGMAITATLTVSANAINGVTGMRLRSRSSTAQNDSTSACSAFATGETEDYLITIVGGLAVGIENYNEAASIEIFPNPSQGEVTISVKSMYAGKSVCQLIDLNGKIIVSENLTGNCTKKIDLSLFEKGVYLLRYLNEKGLITKKIVLQ
ncbi:MAG: GEVED domain-containing protein [Bacteroidia bacterium]